ncbi:hypothetical protein [Streptomyces hydrogenans]|uniref:Uncharacterized protein n=1 Tax=Streptomyces hydrogenans TaxID=1873719 RepID=A0ABQ3PJM2_9ACTN|nr:hypothetical protein [Streptomyces hydrogenans]GHG09988.1 hypothetical protein GCM10018784_23310 [Streptomyces hydrogenans]GHI25217.1 hypothetical protein Shyd_65880 [Streptomyces hydrogenans]
MSDEENLRVYLRVDTADNGMVSLSIHYEHNHAKIAGVLVTGTHARNTAERLTMASFKSEKALLEKIQEQFNNEGDTE